MAQGGRVDRIALAHLRTFVLVAESGSFTGAATGARRTQPTVSRQVRALEEALGARLLVRTGRQAVTTEAGRRFLGYARQLLTLLDEARDAVAADGRRAVRTLRVGAGGMASQYLLPPILESLRAREPAVKLVVATHHPERIVERIVRGELDAGLVTRPLRSRGLATLPIGEDELVAVVGPGHPFAAVPPRRLPPRAFAGQPFILYDRGTGTSKRILGYFARHGVSLDVGMEVAYVEAMKEMVRIGLGATLLPRWAVARDVAAGDIVAVRLGGAGIRRTWALVAPKGGLAAPPVDGLVAVCRERLPLLLAGDAARAGEPAA